MTALSPLIRNTSWMFCPSSALRRRSSSPRSPLTARSAPYALALLDGQLVVNPTVSQLANSKLDLRIAGTKDAVIMVEAGANEVSEETHAGGHRFGPSLVPGHYPLAGRDAAAIGKPKARFPSLSCPRKRPSRPSIPTPPTRSMQILEAPMSKEERSSALGALQGEMVGTAGTDVRARGRQGRL